MAKMKICAMTPDRATFIGGSDAAAILGVSPWTSQFMLYQQKIGAIVEESSPQRDRILKRGKRWEPIVVEMLVDELRERGHDVEIAARNQRYTDPEHSYLAAEIDLELIIDGEEVNGEAKTVHPFAAKAWGEPDSDEIPVYYAAQVMHGLMIRPRRRAVIAALTGFDDRPRVHWIERDEETIAGIRAREIEFWQRVQTRTPPDPTEPADVKWLYQRDGGTVIEADDDLLMICQRLKDAKVDAKKLDERIDLLSTQVKARMGEAATLLYRGAPIATWRNNKQTPRTDFRAAFEQTMALLNACAATSDTAKMLAGEIEAIAARNTKAAPGARPLIIK